MATWKKVVVESGSGAIVQNTTGSAGSLTTPRDFSISGDASAAAVSFNGTSSVDLAISLAASSVNTAELADGAVTTVKIGGDAVTSAQIADDSIGSEHIDDGAILTAAIAANQITNTLMADSAIDTAELAADAVTGAKIEDDAVDTEHIAAAAITGTEISNNTIGSDHLESLCITTTKIQTNSVTAGKLYAGAVETAKIADDAVTIDKIADDAVGSDQIGDDAVTGSHIADTAIDTAHINADAITGSHIANDQIDSEHYVTGSIDNEHLAANCVNGDNIQDGVIDSEHYANTSIDSTHIATNAGISRVINAGAVTTVKIADANVTEAKIEDNAVTLAKMDGITRGSIIYGDDNGDPAYLALGSTGLALVSDGTDLAWGTVSTVGSLADLNDVSSSVASASNGQIMQHDGSDWEAVSNLNSFGFTGDIGFESVLKNTNEIASDNQEHIFIRNEKNGAHNVDYGSKMQFEWKNASTDSNSVRADLSVRRTQDSGSHSISPNLSSAPGVTFSVSQGAVGTVSNSFADYVFTAAHGGAGGAGQGLYLHRPRLNFHLEDSTTTDAISGMNWLDSDILMSEDDENVENGYLARDNMAKFESTATIYNVTNEVSLQYGHADHTALTSSKKNIHSLWNHTFAQMNNNTDPNDGVETVVLDYRVCTDPDGNEAGAGTHRRSFAIGVSHPGTAADDSTFLDKNVTFYAGDNDSYVPGFELKGDATHAKFCVSKDAIYDSGGNQMLSWIAGANPSRSFVGSGTTDFVGDITVATSMFTVDAGTGNVSVFNDLAVGGDLDVTGDIDFATSTDLEVTNKNIYLNDGGTTAASADGGGIIIESDDSNTLHPKLLWSNTNPGAWGHAWHTKTDGSDTSYQLVTGKVLSADPVSGVTDGVPGQLCYNTSSGAMWICDETTGAG